MRALFILAFMLLFASPAVAQDRQFNGGDLPYNNQLVLHQNGSRYYFHLYGMRVGPSSFGRNPIEGRGTFTGDVEVTEFTGSFTIGPEERVTSVMINGCRVFFKRLATDQWEIVHRNCSPSPNADFNGFYPPVD